jgi:carboxylesterase
MYLKMSQPEVLAGAEPFFFEGGEIGCIVCHGFIGTPQSMSFLGESLANEGGLTVIGPRLQGHGTSVEDMAQSTAEEWIRSVEDALQELKKRCSKVFMAGLSMGGTLTLYMAAMHPHGIQGAVPINGAVYIANPDLATLALQPEAPASIPSPGSDIKQPGVFELCYDRYPVPSIRQLFLLAGVTHALLPKVNCPTLVFQSRVDHVVAPGNAPFIVESISAKDKQLVWLENSYHVATLDNDKELIARKTLEFISRACK